MSDLAKEVLGIVLSYHDIPDDRQDEIVEALREFFAERIVTFESDEVTFQDGPHKLKSE